MKRYVALGAALAALGAGSTALGHKAAAGGAAAQAQGGLSMSPTITQHNASPGQLTQVVVANRSAGALAVTVKARPWVQAATGKVSPNRRATLPGVSVNQPTFTLAPGAERVVTANLNSAPSAGYLYGALEVVGVPTDAAVRKGVVLGYRLVGSLRVLPSAPRLGVSIGKVKVSKRTATVAIKNTGNTLDAVSGALSVKSASGTKRSTLGAVKILPGKSIGVPAGSKLAKGSYTATVSLNQRGKKAASATTRFKVK